MTKKEVPQCRCGEPMLWSFSIAFNEWVCVPCGEAEPMFHGSPKMSVSHQKISAMNKKYDHDLKRLAFLKGGASCSDCRKGGGNNCETCKLSESLKYWETNKHIKEEIA